MSHSLTPRRRRRVLLTTPTNEGNGASNIIIMQQQQRDAASTSSMERALRTLTTRTSTPPPPSSSSSSSKSSGSRKSPPRPKSGGHKSRSSSKKQSDNSIRTTTTTISTPTTSINSITASISEEAVKVAIRVRPLVPEGDQCADRAWTISTERNAIFENTGCQRRESIYSSSTTNHHSRTGITLGTSTTTTTESEFVYDRIFGEESNTNEIYNALVSDVVESVTDHGINGTVFTYGQTCSGKTFTMQGCNASESSSVGIIQLASRQIFQSIKERRSDDDDEKMMKSEYSVNVSYVEIYNEELRDLLNDNNNSHKSSSNSLLIRENKHGSITVEGLQEVRVESLEELMNVFRAGEKNKSVGSTKMNDRSSRSHAILSISLERKTTTVLRSDTTDDDKENYEDSSSSSSNLIVKTTSTLNLVDLAGSESVRHTNAAGIQKKEGGMINQSLLTLSKVLMSLGQKYPGHVNYRDSKLTRILKPSLSGNARMVVVCCISPSSKYVEETKSTLQFAARAKLVKTNAVVNEEVQGADIIAKLKMENAKCKMENRMLAEQLREKEIENINTFSTERSLSNLKKFVFSAAANKSRSNRRLVSIVADDHSVISIGREEASVPSMLPTSAYLTSKDDSCIHQTVVCGNDGIFLRALKVKAEQVKSLHDKLRYSKPEKKNNSQMQNRYSLVKLAQSCNGDRRNSLIVEARRSDVEQENEVDQDDNSLTEIDLLESKLAHAKCLIDSLERQIDDLSLQKNDAIDWIEELLAKSDQKDAKIRCLNDEKNVAIKRCEELEDELVITKHLCDEKFCLGTDSVNTRIISLETKIELLEEGNSDLKSQLLDQQNLTVEYDNEKRALIEQIETFAEDLTIANASLKLKSDELDDALFSLETERRKWREETNDLMEQKNNRSSHSHNEINGSIRENVKLLAEENAHNQATVADPIEHCPEKETLHHDNCDMVRVDELMEKNTILTIEQSRLRDENDNLAKRVRNLSDELTEQRRRQTKAAQESVLQENLFKAENARLEQKISDLSKEIRTIQQQLQDANKREENSVVAFFKSESEKLNLKSQLNGANATVKEHSDKIQAMTNELCRYENAKVKHNLTMRKIQEQVDELTLENADLREKNESLTRTLDCLRNEICELRRLQSITIAERNDAYTARDDLVESNANLTCDLKLISVERGRLLHENERIQTTLHKITADYEADNGLLRSNVDSLLKEKVDLEGKIVFLEASKSSIEKKADRILERDNSLTRQHEHLDVEYKRQARINAELQRKIDKMMKRIDCMRLENEKLTRDNRTLRELYQRSARF